MPHRRHDRDDARSRRLPARDRRVSTPRLGDGNRLFNLALAMLGGTATADGRPIPKDQQPDVVSANWSRITNGEKDYSTSFSSPTGSSTPWTAPKA